jgi:hypothetical protein
MGVETTSAPGGRSEYDGVGAGVAESSDLTGSITGVGLTIVAVLKSKSWLEGVLAGSVKAAGDGVSTLALLPEDVWWTTRACS